MPVPDVDLVSNQESQRDYSNPTKKCDMVMKGGITSGVVYPLAVCELAQTYTFKNIGGTSAGAIAAAAIAAAEYGRQHKRPDKNKRNFAELEKLPQWLGDKSPDGKNSNLFALFQPQTSTKRLFNTLTAGLAEGKRVVVFLRVLWASMRNFPLVAILGFLLFPILSIVAIRSESGLLLIRSLVSALLLALVVTLLGTFCSFYRCAVRAIPQNYYGLCTGMPSPPPWFIRWLKWLANKGVLSTWLNRAINRRKVAPSLTFWLTEYLDRLAGVEDRDKPLTFGDLWGEGKERNINLEMLTTNLTLERSYRLPFDTEEFFFHPKEFEELFPKRVVDWMIKKSAKIKDDPSKNTPMLPLPEAVDLPVVVATRLSLSFPILLSAIPFYAVDRTRTLKDMPERCWFSDGGIVSNMPVHFFDKSLPRWPTFAINLLQPPHPDYPLSQNDQCENIWTPTTNSGGIEEAWTRIDDKRGAGNLPGFLGMILNTMQNWLDNAQMRVPGYRDRIMHIKLDPKQEGGLNLNMHPEDINNLSERGRCAGEKLVKRFAADQPVLPVPPTPKPRGWIEYPWDNHRWIRYRSIMSLLEQFLEDFCHGYDNPESGDKTYDELIQRKHQDPPKSYRWESNDQRVFASDTTHELLDLVKKWRGNSQSFDEGTPNPDPVLRVTPKI